MSAARVHDTARALAFLAGHPGEAIDRLRSKLEHARDRSDRRSAEYEAAPDSDRRLHELIGQPLPCPAAGEFDAVWSNVEQSLATSSSFVGEWVHDADPGLARLAWCVVRHLRPQKIVETGVARGITSRILLEALERNGEGRLWSVDLPMLRSRWHEQTAAAVPADRRSGWTYVRGSSRRRLPRLLSELGEIDLFIHDSAHTESNMRYEFETAWPALRSGGVLLSHDITMNAAFADFGAAAPAEPLFARYADSRGLVGVLVKP
jgi:predicted O-methyltransferase YrrM